MQHRLGSLVAREWGTYPISQQIISRAELTDVPTVLTPHTYLKLTDF